MPLKQSLYDLLAPLREELKELDAEIAVQEQGLAENRQTRRNIVSVLDRLDPSSVPVKTTVKYPKVGRVSKETVESVFIRLKGKPEVNGNGGFTITSLRRDFGFGDMSMSTLQKSIAVLHEQGVVRIDHKGRGGSHYYKLVG